MCVYNFRDVGLMDGNTILAVNLERSALPGLVGVEACFISGCWGFVWVAGPADRFAPSNKLIAR